MFVSHSLASLVPVLFTDTHQTQTSMDGSGSRYYSLHFHLSLFRLLYLAQSFRLFVPAHLSPAHSPPYGPTPLEGVTTVPTNRAGIDLKRGERAEVEVSQHSVLHTVTPLQTLPSSFPCLSFVHLSRINITGSLGVRRYLCSVHAV